MEIFAVKEEMEVFSKTEEFCIYKVLSDNEESMLDSQHAN